MPICFFFQKHLSDSIMDFLTKTIGGTLSSIKSLNVPYTLGDKINDPLDSTFPSIWTIYDSVAKVRYLFNKLILVAHANFSGRRFKMHDFRV